MKLQTGPTQMEKTKIILIVPLNKLMRLTLKYVFVDTISCAVDMYNISICFPQRKYKSPFRASHVPSQKTVNIHSLDYMIV